MRPLSNVMILGSDVLGMLVLIMGPILFMRLVVKEARWSSNKKAFILVGVGVATAIVLFMMINAMWSYIFGTEEYYGYTQPYFGGYWWLTSYFW